jgi:hypothetical protein
MVAMPGLMGDGVSHLTVIFVGDQIAADRDSIISLDIIW